MGEFGSRRVYSDLKGQRREVDNRVSDMRAFRDDDFREEEDKEGQWT